MNAPASVTQLEIDQRVFDLYDEYCHGRIDRREFLARSAALVVGGLAMAQALLPRYAQAQTISFTDTRMKAQYVNYPSPGGNSGQMRGYLVQPAGGRNWDHHYPARLALAFDCTELQPGGLAQDDLLEGQAFAEAQHLRAQTADRARRHLYDPGAAVIQP